MTLDQVCELWRELKRYISDTEIEEAADTVLHFMIDNNVDTDDVKDSFKHDRHVREALAEYLEEDEEELDEEEFYDD